MIKQIIGCLLITTSITSLAEENEETKSESLFEIGAGFSIVDVAHYAGSDQSELYALPFPFVVYQTDKVSLNREGLKGHLVDTSKWDLDISFSGTLPVDSDDNRARRGMPDLDWVGMAGPSINYTISSSNESLVRLLMPLHLGGATDFSNWEYIGWEFAPSIRWDHTIKSNNVQWQIIASSSVYYASEKYADYFYTVDPQYALIDRPAYKANAGYAGYQAVFGVTRRKDNFWMGAFVRHRSLSGAEFEDSPLVKQKNNLYAGVAFAWIIHSRHF